MQDPDRFVPCPRCGVLIPWGPQSPFRPFCSERCKAVDLGAWATEQYRVATVEENQEPDEEERAPPQ